MNVKRRWESSRLVWRQRTRQGALLVLAVAFSSTRARAEEHPLREDETPRSGYHMEERPRPGLLYTGIALAGAGYLMAVLETPNTDNGGLLLVPVVGPWIWLSGDHTESGPRGDVPDASSFKPAVVGFAGILEVGGALLTTLGLTATKTWVVPNEHATATMVAPRVYPGGAGVFVWGAL